MKFESNSNFEQPPVGPHTAQFIGFVDLGTQKGEYQGKPTENRQVLITWELPYEKNEEGKPFTIGKFYTQSLGEKANLTKDLTSLLGKAPAAPKTPEENKVFVEKTFKPLLGKGCQIVISEKEDTGKRRVSAVIGLGKGTTVPAETTNPLVFFDLDNYDEEVFDGLSEWAQKTIMASPEYAKAVSGESPADSKDNNDDVPF